MKNLESLIVKFAQVKFAQITTSHEELEKFNEVLDQGKTLLQNMVIAINNLDESDFNDLYNQWLKIGGPSYGFGGQLGERARQQLWSSVGMSSEVKTIKDWTGRRKTKYLSAEIQEAMDMLQRDPTSKVGIAPKPEMQEAWSRLPKNIRDSAWKQWLAFIKNDSSTKSESSSGLSETTSAKSNSSENLEVQKRLTVWLQKNPGQDFNNEIDNDLIQFNEVHPWSGGTYKYKNDPSGKIHKDVDGSWGPRSTRMLEHYAKSVGAASPSESRKKILADSTLGSGDNYKSAKLYNMIEKFSNMVK